MRITRLILAAGLVPAFGVLGFSTTVSATVPDTVAVYGSAARAAGIHMIAGTSQFPNWDPGAVDNRYPLASVGSDAGPSSHAGASAADYGPAAATVAASDPPQPFCTSPAPSNLCTPQTTIPHNPPPDVYALAQYPTPPGKPEDHYSNGGSDRADAYAKELQADADGTYAGGTPGSPFSQATAETHTIVNPDGSIHVYTHSHVQSATFGPIVIRDVDVKTDVLSKNGKAVATATINAGTVQNGTDKPTEVTTQGVTLEPPGIGGLPISVHIFAVKPDSKVDGGAGTITATGTHVVVDQPVVQNQFSHHVEYILGEGFSQAYLVSATPITSSGDSSSSVDTGSTGDTGGGTSTTTITNPGLDSGFTGAAPSVVTANAHKATPGAKRRSIALVSGRVPMPIAAMFFLWEALVLGAAASAVWARRATSVPK
jgi:hypothetical protein